MSMHPPSLHISDMVSYSTNNETGPPKHYYPGMKCPQLPGPPPHVTQVAKNNPARHELNNSRYNNKKGPANLFEGVNQQFP